MTEDPVYIGIDAGGTRTRMVMQRGSSMDRWNGPPAQLQRMGREGAADALARLIRDSLPEVDAARPHRLVAGVAGAGDPREQHALATALSERLSRDMTIEVRVVQDAEIALEGAFAGESGMIVIAGTGSVVVARGQAGSFYKSGGWGFLLGDEGSGHALGLEALRALARAIDGGPSTALREMIAEQFDVCDRASLIERVYQSEWPIQQVAPLVLEATQQGDAVARRVLLDQTQALARQAKRLVTQHPDITPRFALLGGLTRNDTYSHALTNALHDLLPEWERALPHETPVMGALRMARR